MKVIAVPVKSKKIVKSNLYPFKKNSTSGIIFELQCFWFNASRKKFAFYSLSYVEINFLLIFIRLEFLIRYGESYLNMQQFWCDFLWYAIINQSLVDYSFYFGSLLPGWFTFHEWMYFHTSFTLLLALFKLKDQISF